MSLSISLKDIQAARKTLSSLFDHSPLVKNDWLSQQLGCEIYLKLENMLPIGSFKIRGASYRISRLSPAEKKAGVVAASAGNHAQGVAWGALKLGTHATIVMPKNAPIMKVQNTRALGAEVHLEGSNYDEAFEFAQKLVREGGKTYIHAFEDPDVIAGQGTLALELLDQLPNPEVVICAIGGGGLLGGVGTVLKQLSPNTQIIGCQASGAPSMLKSLEAGHAIELESVNTFADGIAVKRASESMREILAQCVDHTEEASDEEIASSIVSLLEKAKIISEGAGALPLAVLKKIHSRFKGKKVVLIIGGGNIDINIISRIIDRGLILAGRRLRLNVMLSDKPGSLARLTELIAHQGGNVLQAIHDRNEPSVRFNETDVALTLETRGKEHSDELILALRTHGFSITINT